MPLGTSYVIKTLRLLLWEDKAIEYACAALGGMEVSQLIQEAVLFEANRLGIRYSTTRPDPLEEPWPYAPERGEGATGVRISISMRVTVAELMTRAAAHVEVSEPAFIIGSTLAYIGRLQRCYQGELLEPKDAERSLAALRRISLPPQYAYGRSGRS